MVCSGRVATRQRTAFTLVELVIVVLIIGILAAVAVPKLFDTSTEARNAGTRQSLVVVRNAIELYRAQNGALPGEAGTEADLKSDLANYIQGPFPATTIGNQGNDVRIQTDGNALSASGTQAWAYDNQSGEFIINHSSFSGW